MKGRRKDDRSRVLLKGRVIADLNGAALDCVIYNLSSSGARIFLVNDAPLPEEFDLAVIKHEKVYRARIAWRRVDEFGLAFIDKTAGETAELEPAVQA